MKNFNVFSEIGWSEYRGRGAFIKGIHTVALFPSFQASDKIGPGTDPRAVALLPLLKKWGLLQ